MGCFEEGECFRGQGCCWNWKQCLGAGDQTCHQKWGLNLALKPNMVTSKFQHHPLFVIPTKVTLNLEAIHHLLTLPHWQRIITLFPNFQMNISPCGVKINIFEISMWSCVNSTFAAISPDHIFGLYYQHQVLELMSLWTVRIFLPYQINWVYEPLNTACETPLPKTKWFSLVSNLWCQLFIILLYWGQCTTSKQ